MESEKIQLLLREKELLEKNKHRNIKKVIENKDSKKEVIVVKKQEKKQEQEIFL